MCHVKAPLAPSIGKANDKKPANDNGKTACLFEDLHLDA
jgi:hypothetical protein